MADNTFTSICFPFSYSVKSLVILGPEKSGKTSLSFRLAYENAFNAGIPYFCTKKDKIESHFPLNVSLSYATETFLPIILNRIQMKYFSSINDLFSFLNGIHLLKPQPSMIIIDDIFSFLNSNSKLSASTVYEFVFAHISNSIYLNNNNIKIIVTSNYRGDLQVINSARRHFDGILSIKSIDDFYAIETQLKYIGDDGNTDFKEFPLFTNIRVKEDSHIINFEIKSD